MSWADIVILGIVAVSAVVSLFRGLMREVLSLVAWVVAFWIAIAGYPALSLPLEPLISVQWGRDAASFLILLVATLIVGGIVNIIVGRIIATGGLSGPDRLFGVAFGVARGVAIVGVVALILGATPLAQTGLWSSSALLPGLQRYATAVAAEYSHYARVPGPAPRTANAAVER